MDLAPRLPTIDSPETSNSASVATPSPHQPTGSALVSLSPPPTVRRTSSHSAIPTRHHLRNISTSSVSDLGREDDDDDEASENVLTALSINISPGKKRGNGAGSSRTPYHGGPSKRSGRHSVAADLGAGPMTLRDQEQVSPTHGDSNVYVVPAETDQQIEQMKKDLFNLQLENHFLKDRLANTTDEHFRAMHNENVKLKLEVVNYAKEMKRLKKIILQQDKGMKELQKQLDDLSLRGQRGEGDAEAARRLEGLWHEEKERRKKLEEVVREYEDGKADISGLRKELDDAEKWRGRYQEIEEELKGVKEDHAEEVERLRDEVDRAQEELERVQAEGGDSGLSQDAEDRLNSQIADLEEEVERLRRQGADDEELEEVRSSSS